LKLLSKLDPKKAGFAVELFFSLPINMIQIDEKTLQTAAEITAKSGVAYDSVHAACMCAKSLDTVVAEDVKDWRRIGGFRILRSLDYRKNVEK